MSVTGFDHHTVEQAVAAARALDQPAFISVRAEDDVPPAPAGASVLAGMPFAVKDNIDVAGFVTTVGNPATIAVSSTSATVVELLSAAGAVAIGKTNLDQYATGLVGTRTPYGACHSVYSADHVSGGSSSGSAIAVATGVVPFALGTDTAGSGRVPPAFNGLIGMKPTRGLVSTAGVFPACRSLDCVTVMTRTIELARAVLEVIAQFDAADPYSRHQPHQRSQLRRERPVLGVPAQELDLEPAAGKAWEQALARAADIGELVEIDIDPFLRAAELLYAGPWLAERALAFGHLLGDGPGINPTVRSVLSGADRITGQDAFRGMYRLAGLSRQTEPTWERVDALMLPTTPNHPSLAEVAADPIGANSALGRFTNMVNLLDLAAIAVPAGLRVDGLPFGVQFLGPAFSDHLLLDLGAFWLDGSDGDVRRP